MSERLFQARDAEVYTGVPRDYIIDQAKAGRLAFIKPSPKKYVFRKSDLDAWMKSWTRGYVSKYVDIKE